MANDRGGLQSGFINLSLLYQISDFAIGNSFTCRRNVGSGEQQIADKQRGNHQRPDLLHARAEFWLIRRCCLPIHFTAAHKIRANDT
jgi:hypothetical protein